MEKLKSKIRTIPDFPKRGVLFRDVTTLMKDARAWRDALDLLVQRYVDHDIDLVAGIESRGFILGGAMAYQLGAGFVPIRKKGKLPSKTESVTYSLEYGTDTIEVHADAIQPGSRVLLVDDLIATGGTATAACELITKLGGEVVECAFLVELPDLHGRERLGDRTVFSLITFDGE